MGERNRQQGTKANCLLPDDAKAYVRHFFT